MENDFWNFEERYIFFYVDQFSFDVELFLNTCFERFNFSTGMIFYSFFFSLSLSLPLWKPCFSPSHPLIQREPESMYDILDRETKIRGRKIKYSVLLQLSTSISYFYLSIYLYLLSSSVNRHLRIVIS